MRSPERSRIGQSGRVSHSSWRPNDPWDPRNPDNRERTRALVPQLRERLLAWDPIGVADTPEAQDEYDCLISPLMHRLSDGASEHDLGDWLIAELTGHFGMTANEPRERALARDLKQWWQSSTMPA